jgi:biopolymer transport protein ExbD
MGHRGLRMLTIIKEAGPFAFLSLAAGGMGLLLSLVTAALAAGKSTTAPKVTAALCLIIALGILGVGVAGYSIGMTTTMRAVANIPDDVKDLIIHKGTQESRQNFLVALAASALPMIAGLLAMAIARAWAGVAFALLTAAAWGGELYAYTRPLPPAGPTVVEVPGLQLPHSLAGHTLAAGAFIALTPDGLYANGAKVARPGDVLLDPMVRERNTGALMLLVDARVHFAQLLEVLEELGARDRHRFALVVLGTGGERRVLEVRDDAAEPADKLKLTLFIAPKQLQLGAIGGALQPLTHDWAALNKTLAEVKTSFPDNHTLRVSADGDVTVDELVKALEAAREKDQKVVNDDLVVGKFTLPKPQ